ncbi:MAG: glycosyltransferase, partial [Chitinophagaceae bacterium]
MSKLAIITTHPVQYYAPVFKRLTQVHPQTKVFYTWGTASIEKYDPDFRKVIAWDIPLLDGYDYEFLANSSARPGTSHFRGIVNPKILQAINNYGADILLIYGWSWQSHLQIMRHFAGKKKIWFRGDSTCLDPIPQLKAFFRRQLLRWVYSHVDLAFYVGTENRKYYQHVGLRDNQLRFAPHAIDNNRYSSNQKDESRRIRKELGISETGTVILFAGKFEPKKDPFVLLDAFEAIQGDNIFLLFVGNGMLEAELKDRSE